MDAEEPTMRALAGAQPSDSLSLACPCLGLSFPCSNMKDCLDSVPRPPPTPTPRAQALMDQFVLGGRLEPTTCHSMGKCFQAEQIARALSLILLRVNNFQKLIGVDE